MCKASEYNGGRGEYSSYEGRGDFSPSSAIPCECPGEKAIEDKSAKQIEKKSPLQITDRTLSKWGVQW